MRGEIIMKKIISMVAALSMMLSAAAFTTVAHATSGPSLTVEVANVSDETWAAGTTFELHVSYDGVETSLNEDTGAGTALTAVQFEIGLPDYDTKYTKNGFSYLIKSTNFSAATPALNDADTKGKYVYFGWAGDPTPEGAYRVGSGQVLTIKLKTLVEGNPGDFYIRTDDASANGAAKIGTITFDDNLAIASQAEYTYDSKEYKLTLYPSANVGPTLETIQATEFEYDENAQLEDKESVKNDSEDVNVYKASYTFKTGHTKYFWSATIGGTTKKTADTPLPITEGSAVFGIIIPVSVGATGVALNVQ